MHGKIYKDYVNRKKHCKFAVYKLDKYIRKCEMRKTHTRVPNNCIREHAHLLGLVERLQQAIENEERNKERAFENLRKSNEAIKVTISELRNSMKTYRENIRSELANLNNLSTNRLIDINPECV